MVKNRHDAIRRIQYEPPAADAIGLEVMSIAEFRRRMRQREIVAGVREPQHRTERPEFHLLLAVEEGLSWHMVDFTDYALDSDRWLWVRPGQVQQFGDLEAMEGTLLLFQADFLDPAVSSQVRLDDPFGPVVWSVAGAAEPDLVHALGDVTREYRTSVLPPPTRAAVLQHLLAVLLLRLTDRTNPAGTALAESPETFQRFRAAVERDYATTRDVGRYARRLGYAPRTLTRATLAAAGIGAKEFIDRRVVLEAKRLLAHGDQPVASVATSLGFLDASNFVKYFSARTGTSPAVFRRRFRG